VDDLVGLVPYLLGFHPEESLVAMVLQEGRVVVTARVDLAAVTGVDDLDDLLARLFGRFPASEGWFLAYTDDDALAWHVLAGCVELVGLARLGRVLQVGSEQWRADCPDGPTGPVGVTVTATAAQAAALGLPARRSRRDLADGLAAPPDAEVDGLVAEFDARSAELDALSPRARRRLLGRLLAGSGQLARPDCVRLALLVAADEGQVAALGRLERGAAERHLQVWSQVLRHSLSAYRPAVLGLIGFAAWQTGDGALQMVCLEQLDLVDPLAPMAALLDWLNANVVPPEEWDRLRPSLLSALEAGLRGAVAGPPASPPRR
jgi:hypothetical protein